MSTDPCQSIIDEIASLEDDIGGLQDLLQTASPEEKADLLKQIKDKNKKLAEKQRQLTKCLEQNPSPEIPAEPAPNPIYVSEKATSPGNGTVAKPFRRITDAVSLARNMRHQSQAPIT